MQNQKKKKEKRKCVYTGSKEVETNHIWDDMSNINMTECRSYQCV